MNARRRSLLTGLVIVFSFCLLSADFADARRGGGGGGGMRGGSMNRMGPASRGSFQRPQAQPRPSQQPRERQEARPSQQPRQQQEARPTQRDQTADRSQEDRQQRQQERQDNRQENIAGREDFRQERWDDIDDYYDDRQDWYQDHWAHGTYVSVSVWSTMSCSTVPIHSNGLTFYDCQGVRYEQVMYGSQVTYIIVK